MEVRTYREEVFVIEWLTLPQEQKDYVHYILDDRFANDVLIKWPTEFEPCGIYEDEVAIDGNGQVISERDFKDTLTMDRVTKYWKDQQDTNGFVGNLKEFIKDYGLEFDIWIIEQNFDLKDIKSIYIDISW